MHSFSLLQIVVGVVFAAVVGWFSYRLQLLTLGASFTAAFLGCIVFGLGGLQWALPILIFFGISSALSKIGTHSGSTALDIFEKSSRRDVWQVLANGGLSGMLVIVWVMTHDERLYILNLGVLAAVNADTWGTELGVLYGGRPILFRTWKKVEAGTSGAVSILGISVSLTGSLVIAISGCFWVERSVLVTIVCVTLSGLIGAIVDSILGGTVQAQYRCVKCQKLTERKNHCQLDTVYERGFPAVNNDVVNFFCGITGAVSVLILISLFKLF